MQLLAIRSDNALGNAPARDLSICTVVRSAQLHKRRSLLLLQLHFVVEVPNPCSAPQECEQQHVCGSCLHVLEHNVHALRHWRILEDGITILLAPLLLVHVCVQV